MLTAAHNGMAFEGLANQAENIDELTRLICCSRTPEHAGTCCPISTRTGAGKQVPSG